MKYIKLFESFVNEELTQGTKLSQALILHMGKQPQEKGPEMDRWEKDEEDYKKSLKDYLKQYDIDVTIHPGYSNGLYLYMNFPESFMSNVKRFFGFGKSKISLNYSVTNLTDLTDSQLLPIPASRRSSFDSIEERVSISIGVDRQNTPSISYANGASGDKISDISKIDPSRKQYENIKLDKEDAQMMCKILQDINPVTKFSDPQILVEALNEQLEGNFKDDVERSQKDPGYKFVVLNRIVLVG